MHIHTEPCSVSPEGKGNESSYTLHMNTQTVTIFVCLLSPAGREVVGQV